MKPGGTTTAQAPRATASVTKREPSLLVREEQRIMFRAVHCENRKQGARSPHPSFPEPAQEVYWKGDRGESRSITPE
jgi:hypothetical protein